MVIGILLGIFGIVIGILLGSGIFGRLGMLVGFGKFGIVGSGGKFTLGRVGIAG